jgi:hypothetical protein
VETPTQPASRPNVDNPGPPSASSAPVPLDALAVDAGGHTAHGGSDVSGGQEGSSGETARSGVDGRRQEFGDLMGANCDDLKKYCDEHVRVTEVAHKRPTVGHSEATQGFSLYIPLDEIIKGLRDVGKASSIIQQRDGKFVPNRAILRQYFPTHNWGQITRHKKQQVLVLDFPDSHSAVAARLEQGARLCNYPNDQAHLTFRLHYWDGKTHAARFPRALCVDRLTIHNIDASSMDEAIGCVQEAVCKIHQIHGEKREFWRLVEKDMSALVQSDSSYTVFMNVYGLPLAQLIVDNLHKPGRTFGMGLENATVTGLGDLEWCAKCKGRGHPPHKCNFFCIRIDTKKDIVFNGSRAQTLQKMLGADEFYMGNKPGWRSWRPWINLVYRKRSSFTHGLMLAVTLCKDPVQRILRVTTSLNGVPTSCDICGAMDAESTSTGVSPHAYYPERCPLVLQRGAPNSIPVAGAASRMRTGTDSEDCVMANSAAQSPLPARS